MHKHEREHADSESSHVVCLIVGDAAVCYSGAFTPSLWLLPAKNPN